MMMANSKALLVQSFLHYFEGQISRLPRPLSFEVLLIFSQTSYEKKCFILYNFKRNADNKRISILIQVPFPIPP